MLRNFKQKSTSDNHSTYPSKPIRFLELKLFNPGLKNNAIIKTSVHLGNLLAPRPALNRKVIELGCFRISVVSATLTASVVYCTQRLRFKERAAHCGASSWWPSNSWAPSDNAASLSSECVVIMWMIMVARINTVKGKTDPREVFQ